jgi:prepilin-type N-terminal cleavage/methylation domain-containing protein
MIRDFTSQHTKAFTLVELLVVITILGLLAGLATPVLGRARKAGEQAAESSAAKNLITAYLAASQDRGGVLVQGYDEDGEATHANGTPFEVNTSEATRWPWRLAPYLNYQMEGSVLVNERASSLDPLNPGDSYLVSASPSLGMNSYFVGGHENGQPGITYLTNGVCVTRLVQAEKPSMLIVFCSAWGLDPSRRRNVDGYYYVTGPNSFPRWPSSFHQNSSARAYGNVRMGYGGRAVTAQLDGSVGLLNFEELRDMRRWANGAAIANNPNWTP